MNNLPPPPIRESDQNTRVWQAWYLKISQFLSTNSFPWTFISKVGSSLTDIETRPHSALQDVLGSGSHHLSATEHTDLTDAGDSALHFHSTDRDRANHTGTQLLATISDAGNSAGLDVGTTAGTVCAGDDYRLGGGATFTQYEANLGSVPVPNGSFSITGTGLTTGKTVLIAQSAAAYTGKGTYADEIEMDQIVISAYVQDATTIKCHWGSNTRVAGNVKFNYLVSA